MSIFWFPEPVSSSKILYQMGYLIKEGSYTSGTEKQIIEIEVPRRKIEVDAYIVLNDKYKRTEDINVDIKYLGN